MIDLLYTIIIFPLVQIIEVFFLFIYRIFHSPVVSLLGVSFAITLLTLPLYIKAEEWQKKERNIQQKMSSKIKKIKTVFKGDEQYMILSVYYRQNHYHPIFSLRSTFSLLIQIPFFIAAWSFISGLDMLNEVSFFGISSLVTPDGLLKLDAKYINILPLIMTAINLISCFIYTKGFAKKEKIQLYVTAAIFLVLLYNSPSGLVLYWTFNNIFSLIKNIIQRFKISVQRLFFILLPFVVLFDIYVLFIHRGALFKKLLVFSITVIFILGFLFYKKMFNLLKSFKHRHFLETNKYIYSVKFILSVSILLILSGLVIPSALIASSPEEFSFIESYTTPFPFIFNVFLQSFGFFVFWPLCLYLFFSDKIKQYFSIIFSILAITAIINTFLVFENFGHLTNLLIFSDPKRALANILPVSINMLIIILTVLFITYIYNRLIFKSIQIISIFALLVLGIINIYRINSAYNIIAEKKNSENIHSNRIEPSFTLSKEGMNVMLIMLDMAMPGYIPEIFNEKPEILRSFSGFTWYPNCISFGGHTFIGAPPIYGGYEYAPLEINKRNTTPLVEKQKEAYLLLPLIFSNSSWSVMLNDLPSEIELFSEYPDIKADNLSGKFTSTWMESHSDISSFNICDRLNAFLIRFSFFKMLPLAFRNFLYDLSRWLSTKTTASGALTFFNISDYAFLEYLPDLTTIISEEQNNFLEIYGHLTHNPAYFQPPDYIPSNNITNKGNSKFSEEAEYHVNMASFLLLARFFDYLDENDVYDNTRIIIVSDHGSGISSDYEGNIQIPNGHMLQSYHALLMFKDFNERSDSDKNYIKISNDFMSNADAALFAVKDIINNPINPFTRRPLTSQKENGLTIAANFLRNSGQHRKYEYKINSNQWLYVKENIFDSANWSTIRK